MITPELIESKDFKKGFRGYNEAEVDIFLDEIREDLEATLKENEALKEKLAMYKDQVGKYSSIEETLKETLITAQSAAEDTTNAANKKARVIVQEAELQSKQMIDKANNKVVEIRRSEEHTSELQSRQYLVCRLLLEKKNDYLFYWYLC